MKNVIITGANSYIGVSFEQYLKKERPDWTVKTIDMLNPEWKKERFSGYDAVFHVAGMVHRKETPENAHLYYEVNRDLAAEAAEKAKREGVRQFVFLSSASVYGKIEGVIGRDTLPEPQTHYGKSKYEAEIALRKLEGSGFSVACLRPPMVYGKGCKGNYQLLRKFALKLPVFPSLENQRSLLFIDNLSDFVMRVIEDEKSGVFLPQNREYVRTRDLVDLITQCHGKKIRFIHVFNPVIRRLRLPVVQKVFGTLIYAEFDAAGTVDLEESIRKTEA